MSQPAPPELTLLVMTRNEAATIARCLDSVPFAAEKIVIDSGSTDQTVSIASAHGARVVHQPWLGYGAQRVFATGLATHPWILFLDADEWLSDELAVSIRTALPKFAAEKIAAAKFKRCTWFLGAPMRWYRPLTAQTVTRLYHRDRATWNTSRVHESLITNGAVVALRGRLMEHGVPTLLHRQLKDLEYAELKVRDWLASGARPKVVWSAPFVFMAAFLKEYLLRLGILDGSRGAVAAWLAANYAAYKRLRYWDARRQGAQGVNKGVETDAILERLRRP